RIAADIARKRRCRFGFGLEVRPPHLGRRLPRREGGNMVPRRYPRGFTRREFLYFGGRRSWPRLAGLRPTSPPPSQEDRALPPPGCQESPRSASVSRPSRSAGN